ncbi:HNH endonuclease [Pseudomonas sp. 008]|uniref:HNH endonuclease n=1 Tax=Pseudomonas sp. 008 TaxID=2803906 RepID=UPI001EF2C8A4|nr:HNH endonuclease [Pseudomonas sp. 008]
MKDISEVLNELDLPREPGLKFAMNVGKGRMARLIRLIQGKASEKDTGGGNLGDSRMWEKALAAVTQLGGTASRKQVEDWILARDPGYNTKNLADLYMMAVNSPARTGYSQNEKPRRTDQGNRYDRLFKVGKGIFEIYDPAQHGIWEIYPDASSGSRFGVSIRRVSNPVEEALAVAEDAAEQAVIFDPTDVADARKRATADIIRRRGQPAFRKALMDAYGDACAITGCNLPAVLEAAHVHPYKGDHTNVVSNGLLLRADIHTLFDLRLIAIESETMVVRVSPKLEDTEYGKLDGSPLRQPKQNSHRVSPEALDWHWNQCGWYD